MLTTTDPNTILASLYAVIIVTTFFFFWQRRRFLKLGWQFPGPAEVPFLGAFHYITSPVEALPSLKIVIDIFKTQTLFSHYASQPLLYTIDPNLLEKVLTSPDFHNKADILYEPLGNIFGDGIFSSKAEKWHRHRKLINPSFRIPILRTFLPIFNKNMIPFKLQLTQMVKHGEVANLSEMLQKLTLVNAVETILGREIESGAGVDDQIVGHFNRIMKSIIMMIMLNFFKLSNLAKHLSFYKSRNAVISFVEEILQNRATKKKLSNDNNNSKKDQDDLAFPSNNNENIFVDQAFKNLEQGKFNWQDIIDESTTILFGAFDTTASATFFALTFLAMYPEVQEKLFEEIKSVFPDKDFIVKNEDMEKCTYLDMVINETLRLAPTVPTVARATVKDTPLTDGIILPKDLLVLVNIFQVHRNVEHWGPDAEKFNPDNFLPENIQQRHPFAFMPFSKGLRNCLGGRYAPLAIKVVLLHTLRNFRFSTDFKYEDLEFASYIVLKVQKSPILKIFAREN